MRTGQSGNIWSERIVLMPQTLLEKLWQRHSVREESGGRTLLYVDRLLVYEVTSPQAFEALRLAGRSAWRAESVLATCDHNVPTTSRALGVKDALSRLQIETLSRNCQDFGIAELGINNPRQGIVHVIGPELGATLPGMSVVCGDSHTSTHGALGALAFGVGTSDVEHVLATQCLSVRRMEPMNVRVHGILPRGLSAKDVILTIIRALGTDGATGCAIEFSGSAIRAMSVESRMTLCNMAIEAGARIGLIGVDETTLDYVKARPLAPKGPLWQQAEAYWRTLVSDADAEFSRSLDFDVTGMRPLVTWGTTPDMAVAVDDRVPDPEAEKNPVKRDSMIRALRYMDLTPGTPMESVTLDKVFIGSCTNSRIEDLRAAAEVLRGNKIAKGIKLAIAVPGSGLVKAKAEAEGLDQIFMAAGFEWREPGCSMCLGMNEDRLNPGERCASTSNRNFEGRQGFGGRSHLVSPVMAAAAAIAGRFVDVTRFYH
jgi:3-isopropylmalate/(R)-2-methylmalate dehydratase large subunit